MESYLTPEPLLQSDDPDIISAAKDIIRGERNSVRAAKSLNDWLFEHIEKKPTLSLPSAREVWSTKQGDCNEHTALYTALARAVGIPARMAVGVVYIDGAFYYHAWPEVWMGQAGWVPVDPTFGEFPADATHIRLAIGGLKNQLAVTRFLGKLKIEIMEM
jgi:transglutaminase-like putative cysteine protease